MVRAIVRPRSTVPVTVAICWRVTSADGSGRPLDLLRSLLRVVLVCLVVPPLVFKPVDQTFHVLALFALAIGVGAAS